MTEVELHTIEKRAEKASAGPWTAWDAPEGESVIRRTWQDDQGRRVTSFIAVCSSTTADNAGNAEFSAHAREDVPSLVAEVRRLTRQLRKLLWR